MVFEKLLLPLLELFVSWDLIEDGDVDLVDRVRVVGVGEEPDLEDFTANEDVRGKDVLETPLVDGALEDNGLAAADLLVVKADLVVPVLLLVDRVVGRELIGSEELDADLEGSKEVDDGEVKVDKDVLEGEGLEYLDDGEANIPDDEKVEELKGRLPLVLLVMSGVSVVLDLAFEMALIVEAGDTSPFDREDRRVDKEMLVKDDMTEAEEELVKLLEATLFDNVWDGLVVAHFV